jgi:hypothetical protein
MQARGNALLKTYTLYLRDGASDDRFEPALCNSDWEARSRAAALLVQHPECETVEVFFGDDLLFRVGALAGP